MRSAGVAPCRPNTLFNKSWDKSLMIDCNLERFANYLANLEHVTPYFDNLVHKNGTLSMIFHGMFYMWIHACPSGRVMVNVSWNLCVQRKNKGCMMHRRARMLTLQWIIKNWTSRVAHWCDKYGFFLLLHKLACDSSHFSKNLSGEIFLEEGYSTNGLQHACILGCVFSNFVI